MTRIHPLIPESFRVERETSELTVVWNIITDEPQTPQSIQSVSGVPIVGDACPLATWLRAVTLDFKPVDSKIWRCTVRYSSSIKEWTMSSQLKPWNNAPTIRYNSNSEMAVVEKYLFADGKYAPILNPAGDPYDTPPQVPRYYTTINLSWNVRRFSDSLIDEFRGTTNHTKVTIDGRPYAVGTVLLSNLYPESKNNGSVDYVTMAAEFVHKSWGHNFQPLFLGWRAKDPADGKVKRIYVDSKGAYTFNQAGAKPASEPVLLNSSGYIITDQTQAKYGDYQYIPQTIWTGLQIPAIRAQKAMRNGLW